MNSLVIHVCDRDMVQFLRSNFDVQVSRFSVSRALKSEQYTKKVTRNVAKEWNADLRADHVYERSFFDSSQLVYIDESGCDTSVGIKNKGWSNKGVTPVQIKRLRRGPRFQIIPAYTQDGALYFEVFEGSTDSERFEKFVERLLPFCGRYPEPRSVLILDNASIHHSERVKQLCEDAGVVLLYLPPYSPDLNPIEEFFGELKRYIQEVWNDYEDLIKTDFGAFLKAAVRVIGRRKQSARCHFKHSGVSSDDSFH